MYHRYVDIIELKLRSTKKKMEAERDVLRFPVRGDR